MNESLAVHLHDLPASPAPQSDRRVPDDLRAWLEHRVELSFAYSRSMGGLIQTGRGVLSAMDSQHLRLRGAGVDMLVVTHGATYSTEPQIFFSPLLADARKVPGVSISLENFDWLFLTTARNTDLSAYGRVLPHA